MRIIKPEGGAGTPETPTPREALAFLVEEADVTAVVRVQSVAPKIVNDDTWVQTRLSGVVLQTIHSNVKFGNGRAVQFVLDGRWRCESGGNFARDVVGGGTYLVFADKDGTDDRAFKAFALLAVGDDGRLVETRSVDAALAEAKGLGSVDLPTMLIGMTITEVSLELAAAR